MTPERPMNEQRAEPLSAFRIELEALAEQGYQPSYNGRPSCPFCLNFIDTEEGHARGCLLVEATAARSQPATEGLTVERVSAALHEMEGPGRHSRPRLTRQICPGPGHHERDAEKFLAALAATEPAAAHPADFLDCEKHSSREQHDAAIRAEGGPSR